MKTVIDDPNEEGPFRSVKVLESEAEVRNATKINDLEEISYHGDGRAYSNSDETITMFADEHLTHAILEFSQEVAE